MKSIQVISQEVENPRFKIKDYYFVEQETTDLQVPPIFKITISKKFNSALEVRYWIEELFTDATFLLDAPEELTKYIKAYEEDLRFSEIYLFHDLRTKYIDFLLLDANAGSSIVFIGYTILSNEVCLAIKAFTLENLVQATENLINACDSKQIQIDTEKNLKWVLLEQYILSNRNIPQNDIYTSFLEKTLDKNYCELFLRAFKAIDSNGYLDLAFFDQDVLIQGRSTKIKDLNRFTKFFTRFWKTDISDVTTNKLKTILCLHDELPTEESQDKIVYTLKPFLKQYYQLKWFEDFCSQMILSMNVPGYSIINSYSGRHFNFFRSQKDSDIRELDFVFGVCHEGSYKIIAIECKKTLSDTEIQRTNRAIRDKILKSHVQIIDAYLHIGCFNNGVVFDKDIDSTPAYKQGIVQVPEDPNVQDVPFFAFTMQPINNFASKFSYIIKTIFDQW